MANDLSFNVIALDKASATFVKLAETIELAQQKLERLDGQDATVDVNVKTDEGRKALDSFQTRFTAMAAGIAAASPLAGAAIVGGLGAGFIAAAAIAQKSNEQVQQTYKTLWSNVVNDTKQATNQLVPELVSAGNQVGHTFEQLGPQIGAGFKAAGPDIAELTRGVTGFAQGAVPGMSSAMQQSLPIFMGISDAATDLGAAVGTSFASIGQNSAAYGTTVRSFGQITSTVITLAVGLINHLAQVWAQNGAEISATVSAVASVVSGLASGSMPVLSAALGAAARVLTVVADAIEPLSPLLGGVGAAALATWAAFKLSGAVTAGITALSGQVLNLGANMEAGAARAAAAGTAIQAAGTRAATASVGMAAVGESLAGPVGLAVAASVVGFGLLSGVMGDASSSGQELAGSMDGVAGALQASNGQINAAVLGALQADPGFKKAAESAGQFGIKSSEVATAITQGQGAYDALVARLQAVVDAQHKWVTVAGGSQVDSGLNDTGKAAQAALDALRGVGDRFKDLRANADQGSIALTQHADALVHSAAGYSAANAAADMFGISQLAAINGLEQIAASSGDASVGLADVARKFAQASLASANAGAAISKTFEQADAQVEQARLSVASAAHGVAQASQSIADAQHGEAQAAKALRDAQLGVADAQHGVQSAQRQYTAAVESERNAQLALSSARQQAIRDLKALHAQLEDQFTNEAGARVRLFDARATAANLGVTDANARDVAGGAVSADNETRVKAAIDLISAQNALNNTLRNGADLRQDVAAADRAGVEGSAGVVSAQKQVESAHQGVTDAAYAVTQAQRGLQRAQEGVSEAAYGLQRAHQAVRDAQYQQAQASQQLTNANRALKDAQDNASRSLDISTEAGRRNLGQLQTLAEAIRSQFGPTAAGYNTLIQQTADKFGITTGAAETLLKKLGDIPKDFKFGMTAVASANFDELNRIYDDKFGGRIGPISQTSAHAFAGGGPVYGPGGPRDDAIDAKLSAGEFVHQTEAVNYYGVPFMHALNQRKIPKFASGGLVGPELNYLLSSAGVAYQTAGHALGTMGLPHPPLLPAYVAPPPLAAGVNLPNYKPGSGVARWSGETLAAMAELSIPGTFLPAVLRRMAQESGGNPTIVNDWDSNWIAGHPSVGLMQVIAGTFAANAGPHRGTGPFSYGVSVDPVSNIYAGLNYAGRRYGKDHGGYLGGVLYAMNKPGGYDHGGQLQPGWTSVFNGGSRPENVRTADAEDALLVELRQLNVRQDRILRALESYAKRPIQGDVTLDRRKVGEFVRDTSNDVTHEAGRGRL